MNRRFCVSILLLCGGCFSLKLAAQSMQPPQASIPPEKRPAEQVYLNIQVLQGVPADELVLGMNAIAGSLGVDCDYCHENNFEQDKIPAKLEARRMMVMTRRINQQNYPAQAAISCFTCHQGQAVPPLGPLLRPHAPRHSEQEAPSPPVASLPTVDQVLDRYVQALGGREAIDKIKSRVEKTSSLDPQSKEVTEISIKLPASVLHVNQSDGYTTNAGFNGKQAWGYDSAKSSWGLLDKGQRVSLIQEGELFPGARLRVSYSHLAITARQKLNDRDVYVLEATSPEDAHEQFFFDTESGLLLRRRTDQQSIFGSAPISVDFDDYRDVDGVKIPFLTEWQSFRSFGIGYHSSRRILEIRQNVEIPDTKFDPPPERAGN